MAELENIANQFNGVDLGQLISGSMGSVTSTNVTSAKCTADYLKVVGLNEDGSVKSCELKWESMVVSGKDGLGNDIVEKDIKKLDIPLIALTGLPNSRIIEADFDFVMEVKSSTDDKFSIGGEAALEAEGKIGWGPFSLGAKISGSMSTHKENTRHSDNSAKLNFRAHMEDTGPTETFLKVMDMMAANTMPVSTNNEKQKAIKDENSEEAKIEKSIAAAHLAVEEAKSKVALAKFDENSDAQSKAETGLTAANREVFIQENALSLWRKSKGVKPFEDIVSDIKGASSAPAIENKAKADTPKAETQPKK